MSFKIMSIIQQVKSIETKTTFRITSNKTRIETLKHQLGTRQMMSFRITSNTIRIETFFHANFLWLRSKRELIEKFNYENLPILDNTDDITPAFDKYWSEERKTRHLAT